MIMMPRMDTSAEDDAHQNPERTGQEAELGGQRGAHQRTRAGDGREVVSEDDPLVRGHVIASVVEPLGRRSPGGVEGEDVARDEPAVEPVGDEIRADSRGE
jgi:hypothetical protein